MGTGKSDYLQPVTQAIDANREELVDISLDIHAHPELNFLEHHAAELLADTLERHGFVVERAVGGVATAVRGTLEGGAGDGPTVALLAEYDALPEIGHGCGHNLIAISNLGEGLGVQAALKNLPGGLVVLGTPAEEGGGGKISMIDADVFDDVDISLFSHPTSNLTIFNSTAAIGEMGVLANVRYRFEFYGKAAHAAAQPGAGINALNAVIHTFDGIDSMRQHLRSDTRIHGIITDGGTAPNVLPEFAAADFVLPSRDRVYLNEIVQKVVDIAD